MSNETDPWHVMPIGIEDGSRIERRADPSHPLDFFRGRLPKGRYYLALKLSDLPVIKNEIPTLGGLEISIVNHSKNYEIVIELIESEQLSIFKALVADILESTKNFKRGDNRQGALSIIVRIERWQRLLRRVKENLLSRQSIIGLVGELLFLRDYILNYVPNGDAIAVWRGPDGDEQDFAIRDWIIEVKTQLSTSDQYIKISSEAQLDTSSGPIIIVYQTLGISTTHDNASITLNGLVAEIKESILNSAPTLIDIFEAKLIAAGYEVRDEYDKESWSIVKRRYYEVKGNFPRIVPSILPFGVQKVSYSILPSTCTSFERDDSWILDEVFSYGSV